MRLQGNLYSGEYKWRDLQEKGEEIKSIWTGARWIIKADEYWLGGPYFRRGNRVFSFKDPELKIELSAKAVNNWYRMRMLAGRPVYRDNAEMMCDATNDAALFNVDHVYDCDAGFAVRVAGKLHFTDGVRKDLPLGEIKWGEDVEFLRVSETEYSIKVGNRRTGYRYFLLDAAKWTCIKI